MRFWVYNLKGCFRFKLDIQFASDFIPQKKMNTVHMFPKRWWKQTKPAFSVFRGKANLALALPGALIYRNIYQQEWQVYDQTGIWTKYELSKPHCYIIRPLLKLIICIKIVFILIYPMTLISCTSCTQPN